MNAQTKYNIFQDRADNGEVIDWLSGSKNCFSCHRDVYEGVSDKDAELGTITGCPYCHRSFCD